MKNISDFDDMPITKVVAQFMNEEGWEDEILVAEDRHSSTIETTLNLAKQPYRLYLESNEVGEVFGVWMYSPYNVPAERVAELSVIINRINRSRLRLGRLAVTDDGADNPIQFGYSIDIEGGVISPKQISTLVNFCFWLERFHQLLASVSLTKIPADDLWAQFLEEEKNL